MSSSLAATPCSRLELYKPIASPASSATVVEASGLSFRYPNKKLALDGVGLTLKAGQMHCLLGESGSGKTTLLRLVAGLEKPDRGEIKIGDDVVSGPHTFTPSEKRPVGMVFQDYALFPHLTVQRNVMFGIRNKPRRERRALATQWLNQVGLAGFENKMPSELSGGQQQRVALARSLAPNPQVVLLDEPFNGIDHIRRVEYRKTTLDIIRKAGVAVLMVTHDPQDALLADEISIMENGRVKINAPTDQVCVHRYQLRDGSERLTCEFCGSPSGVM